MSANPELQRTPELLAEKGPYVIDNIGIRSGSQLVDIAVNPDLVRERFVDLAQKLVPAFTDKAGSLVDDLTISLGGSRSLHEILVDMGQRRLAVLGVPGEAQTSLAEIQAIAFQAAHLFQPVCGATFFDEEQPMILINTPQIQGFEAFRATWDEEAIHLLLQLDPQNRQDFLDESLRFMKTNFGIGLAVALPVTLFIESAFGNRERMSRRQFLSPRRLARRYLQAVAVTSCLAVPVTSYLNYWSSSTETLAWEAAARYPTDETTFFNTFEFSFRQLPDEPQG